MRVIAGMYRSRVLKSLQGLKLRPSSDRLRETLFNVLGAGVSGSRFADVYAGTGAVGIEALSRGAMEVVFIENHAATCALIRKNLSALEIKSRVTVVVSDAVHALETLQKRGAAGFDYIFIDPPYAEMDEYERTLKFLGASNLLTADGLVIAEHHSKIKLPDNFGALAQVRLLKQGDAALSFFRRKSTNEQG